MKKAITAPKFFDGTDFIEGQTLLVEDGYILGFVDESKFGDEWELLEYSEGVVAPGFIDWQVNGGGGVLFNNDTSLEAVDIMTSAHHRGGTTSLMPTFITDTYEQRKLALSVVSDSIVKGNKSVLGLHLEGPFFSVEKRGVHNEKLISQMSEEEHSWLCSISKVPLLLTLAPEKVDLNQILALAGAGVTVNIGHSNAESSLVKEALKYGIKGFTHLYNAMSAATGREPGVVGTALLDKLSWCGIIVDGHHVHPDMVALAHRLKEPGKLCLVTDSMATVFSDVKKFELYGETIKECDGRLVNREGRLAGSCISMIDAVRQTHQEVGLELGECLRMASLHSAQYLNQAGTLGRLSPRYRADMVHFDDEFTVLQTWVAGEEKLSSGLNKEYMK